VPIVTTNRIMVPSEIIALYSEHNKEHSNTLRGIIQFLTLIAVRIYNCYWDLNGQLEQAQSYICVSGIREIRNTYGLSVFKNLKYGHLEQEKGSESIVLKMYYR
jgi:hypothetical protein